VELIKITLLIIEHKICCINSLKLSIFLERIFTIKISLFKKASISLDTFSISITKAFIFVLSKLSFFSFVLVDKFIL